MGSLPFGMFYTCFSCIFFFFLSVRAGYTCKEGVGMLLICWRILEYCLQSYWVKLEGNQVRSSSVAEKHQEVHCTCPLPPPPTRGQPCSTLDFNTLTHKFSSIILLGLVTLDLWMCPVYAYTELSGLCIWRRALPHLGLSGRCSKAQTRALLRVSPASFWKPLSRSPSSYRNNRNVVGIRAHRLWQHTVNLTKASQTQDLLITFLDNFKKEMTNFVSAINKKNKNL